MVVVVVCRGGAAAARAQGGQGCIRAHREGGWEGGGTLRVRQAKAGRLAGGLAGGRVGWRVLQLPCLAAPAAACCYPSRPRPVQHSRRRRRRRRWRHQRRGGPAPRSHPPCSCVAYTKTTARPTANCQRPNNRPTAHLVVPAPGLWVDGLPNAPQQAQGGARVAGHERVALGQQRADGGGRRVEGGHLAAQQHNTKSMAMRATWHGTAWVLCTYAQMAAPHAHGARSWMSGCVRVYQGGRPVGLGLLSHMGVHACTQAPGMAAPLCAHGKNMIV